MLLERAWLVPVAGVVRMNGVDLFADDPLVFKKLIYEMRFDEVSAEYALFGSFYFGMRCPATELSALLNGEWPK